MKKLKSGGTIQSRKIRPSTVSTPSSGVAKRFRRIHAPTPLVLIGAGLADTMSARTNPMSVMAGLLSLNQTDAGVVPVHDRRGQQREGEVNQHGQRDTFDGAAGLVERSTREDVDQFGIADGRAKRRVLREVEILAGQRGNDDP